MQIQTPDWVKKAVFYQIFPDRFKKSDRIIHSRGIQFKPWGTDPKEQGYQGGDLYGIADQLDYLEQLGITAIYLNPIFSSASNHRYHAYDYLEVDPLLGGTAALRDLLDKAHARGMKVILDGVFNHASRGFWAFHHILENGGNSPYIDWFTVYGWPLRPYNSDKNNPPNYGAWWNHPALPKFNIKNPGVRDYILYVTKYWLDFGIDGWRLDVADEIKDDDFWREFRQVVHKANPQAYIVAEIWPFADKWLKGDMFDGVMNYQFTGPTLGFFGARNLSNKHTYSDQNFINYYPHTAEEFKKNLQAMYAHYDPQINHANMTMLDSHDTPRAKFLLNDDKNAFKQAVLCQFTTPGAPCVYYGDEIGMSAGGDPDCRQAFPWTDKAKWDLDILEFYKNTIALRNHHAVLSLGNLEFIHAEKGVVAYTRTLKNTTAIVVLCQLANHTAITLPKAQYGEKEYETIYSLNGAQAEITIGEIGITLPAQSAIVLVSK